jgi:gliding motility-associated lipoprotein GldH
MKQALSFFCSAALIFTLFIWGGCTDPNGIFDQNTEISNHNWAYANPVRYDVKVDDVSAPYNLYLNVRVSGDYRYANLFVLVHINGPALKPEVRRYEVKLANPDGEWLGSGSGNLYSYQVFIKKHYHFPVKGNYHFSIEQNMRDNPLREVSDIGLRVEKVQ